MPRPLTDTHKARILGHIQAGFIDARIAESENCHPSTVKKIRTNWEAYGQHTAPGEFKCKLGRTPKLTPTAVASLIEFLEARPWSYIDEMQDHLFEDTGIFVGESAIGKVLKKNKINRKVLQRVAQERNQEARNRYMLEVSKYTHDQLVAVDESAANERTTWRRRGWGAKGVTPKVVAPVKRDKRWSILPAYTSTGILTYQIHHGSFNSGRFEYFMEHTLLPMCNPFPAPKSVIIIDNCSIHKGQNIKRLCDNVGVKLLYLPPYSPDFNPIEEFFSKMKAWMKRNYELLDGLDSFKQFIHLAIDACGGEDSAKGYFRHAGIYCGDNHEVVSEVESVVESEDWELE